MRLPRYARNDGHFCLSKCHSSLTLLIACRHLRHLASYCRVRPGAWTAIACKATNCRTAPGNGCYSRGHQNLGGHKCRHSNACCSHWCRRVWSTHSYRYPSWWHQPDPARCSPGRSAGAIGAGGIWTCRAQVISV